MAEPHRQSGRKGVASFKAGAEAVGSAEEIEQLVVTFNAAMGEIVKIEKVDKAGKHRSSRRMSVRTWRARMRWRK